MVGSAPRLSPAPNSLLVVDSDRERQQLLCVIAMEFWPNIRTVSAASYTEAEEMLLRSRLDAVIVAGAASDGHPLDFLANVRILLPDILSIQLTADQQPANTSTVLGIVVSFDPSQSHAKLRETLYAAISSRVETKRPPVAA